MTIASGRQRLLTIFVALMIPLAVLVTTWSGLHRHLLAEELKQLQYEQTAWLDRNKRLLASIAIYRSPQRIAELAEQELGLAPISAEHVTVVEPAHPAGGQPSGTESS